MFQGNVFLAQVGSYQSYQNPSLRLLSSSRFSVPGAGIIGMELRAGSVLVKIIIEDIIWLLYFLKRNIFKVKLGTGEMAQQLWFSPQHSCLGAPVPGICCPLLASMATDTHQYQYCPHTHTQIYTEIKLKDVFERTVNSHQSV